MKAAAAQNDDAHEWKSLGMCQWTDDLLPAMFSSVQPYKFEVEVEQDASAPGLYRIVDPYGPLNPYHAELANFLSHDEALRYIYIDATDAANLIIEPSDIGLMYGDEEIFVCSYSYYEKTGEVPDGFCAAQGLVGTLVDGIFSFPGYRALWLSTPSLDARENGFFGNPNGAFRLALPDAKDYSLEILTSAWCTDDEGNVVFSPWGGDDIAYVKAGIVRADADEAALLAIRDSNITYTSRQGAYLSIDGDFGPNEIFYIVAYAYDAAGQLRSSDMHMVYTPGVADGWTTMGAKARFTDYIVSNIYTDINLGTYDVEVQQCDARPGYYRLVDPYINATYNSLMPGSHGAHAHYIYLDATDPACVVLEESPIGMILSQDGDMRVTSDAFIMVQQGVSKDAIAFAKGAGTMKDGVITFPATCRIYAGFNTEGMNSWYYCNYKTDAQGNVIDGDLRIDLSAAIAGVEDVETAADATEHYYNLQGVEVAAPVRGQLLIRTRGSKAEKIRF